MHQFGGDFKRNSDAFELTQQLDRGRWHGSYGTACCPAHDDRNPSLSVSDGSETLLVRCHAGCSQDEVIDALRSMGLWEARRDDARRSSPTWEQVAAASKAKSAGYAERLWRQTQSATGTLVDLYLRDRAIRWAIPPAIRFHPLLPYHDDGKIIGAWPAMVVRLDDADGRFVGIHRTWLEPRIDPNPVDKVRLPNGLPARKTLGTQGVAWLGPHDTDSIIVGEGIESALSASEYGDESWPSWGLTPVAAISATGLAKFKIPPWVHRLFIAEDADEAGRDATKQLALRARAAGIATTIMRVEPLEEAA